MHACVLFLVCVFVYWYLVCKSSSGFSMDHNSSIQLEDLHVKQLFLYWFTQSHSYIQFTMTTWPWFPPLSEVLQNSHQDYTFEQ